MDYATLWVCSRFRMHGGAMQCRTTDAISEMLWCDGANFAQVLEDEHGCIGTTMKRIAAYCRHTELQAVFDRQVKAQAFGEWGMGDGGWGSQTMSRKAWQAPHF